MKHITINGLTNYATAIPPRLIRAVVRQLGGWDEFKNQARDVCWCGAAAGFCGFIYHSDTTAFYAKYRANILHLAESQAEDFGVSAVEMVRDFNCLGRDDYSIAEVARTLYGTPRNHDTYIANALAWFALEEVARAYEDMRENS